MQLREEIEENGRHPIPVPYRFRTGLLGCSVRVGRQLVEAQDECEHRLKDLSPRGDEPEVSPPLTSQSSQPVRDVEVGCLHLG